MKFFCGFDTGGFKDCFYISGIHSVQFLKQNEWVIDNYMRLCDLTIKDGAPASSDIFTKHEDFECFEEKITEDHLIVPQTCINKKYVSSVKNIGNGLYQIELGFDYFEDEGDGVGIGPHSWRQYYNVVLAPDKKELGVLRFYKDYQYGDNDEYGWPKEKKI